MDVPTIFASYCAAVCAQVRWKRAHGGITEELLGHLADHAAALMETGVTEEEARDRAAAAMGDPAEIGRSFNELYSPVLYRLELFMKCSWVLCLTALALILFFNTDFNDLFRSRPPTDRDDNTRRMITGLADMDRLEPGDAAAAWWSGRFGRLDHALLVSGECFLLPAEDGTYTFAFRLYDLSCNPFLESRLLGDREDCFTFSTTAGEVFPARSYSDALGCTGLTPDIRALSVTYSFLGRRSSWTIPLEWGDAA